ncbi:MAG: hypothetical protein H6732_03570 [Alphaproteobacteria bacterium]|nr:hypothetical protein [Alphaproteobacteria bacterium]
MRFGLLVTALLAAQAASAADVAVSVHAGEGPVDEVRTEAVVWHALHLRHGLEPLVVGLDPATDAGEEALAHRLREAHVTTHLDVSVTWRHQVVGVGEGLLAVPPAAEVDVVERTLGADGLQVRRRWHAVGAPAVYRATPGSLTAGTRVRDDGVLTLPDVSLEEAVWVALDPLTVPAWGGGDAPLRVPVVVAGDASYRAFYGVSWRREATARLRAASAILAQAGLTLHPVGFETWEVEQGDDAPDLPGLLADLAARPQRVDEAVLRIAFTQRPPASGPLAGIEDVGRAFTPGREVVVVDQSLPPGHAPAWDVADEGVIVAHEVLHALGAPHEQAPGFVMSAQKAGLVWRLAPRTVSLARAAAEARLVHWDPSAALLSLADSAGRWLDGMPRAQLAYVVENLGEVPEPGALPPERAGALANAALGHAYLRLADEQPRDADRHRSYALAHVQAAIAMAPQLSEDLEVWLQEAGIEAVVGPDPGGPASAPGHLGPDPGQLGPDPGHLVAASPAELSPGQASGAPDGS